MLLRKVGNERILRDFLGHHTERTPRTMLRDSSDFPMCTARAT